MAAEEETSMLDRLQHQIWFKFISQVLTILTVLVVAPIALLASVPVICFLAPVALMAIPFMLGAFFGETKEALPAYQPLRKLQPHMSH
jgi:hypothetical protein